MKQIGSALGGPDLDAALRDFEASRKARKGKARSGPQEASGRAEGVGSVVRSLERTRAAQRATEAAQLEALARKAGLTQEAASQLADGIRAQAPNEWTFIMLSPSQNAAVVRWIMDNSQRPHAAVKLWARLFEVIRNDTGEVMASRSELAAHLGIEPRTLSELMTELASINAIRRERNGRGVRFYMNSTVATHLPAAARKAAQETDGSLLMVMQGGKAAAPD